ncbi:TonB-dependent receptor [Stakelama marina]|uniref:TonB-dependent receptor n=1 Tax=Stakelama marina TaxID=2826939 RepID=A0A8T4IDR0_9SPHN|nr:TonB-dependent receptor [Stakelama marina]MBR0551994.1 TonB-dependent receptor [Stakelama marina]
MKKFDLLAATALTMLAVAPAHAQTADDTSQSTTDQNTGQTTTDTTDTQQTSNLEGSGFGDIVVTAQRQAQRLQDVPIAVTAFTSKALEEQQIVNTSSLQQTLPNVTFTKGNFTSSSFTIRGIGDLCVGVTCDSATAIHVNDMPLLSTRLFETEFYDLERVEVLRGPQGTLFGRNATSGVVNFITAKPDLSGIHAAGEFEYGNFDSKKAKAMFNLPITDTVGVRVAGLYLKRDGYTRNLYDNSRIDGRDIYSVRGTLSWEPTSDTRLDLIGYYFHEKDDRSRIQKQLCHRDPTGILGCAPDTLRNETTNGLSTLAAVLSSNELFALQNPALAPFGLQSLFNPAADPYLGVVNPADVRTVNIDFNPTYYAEEEQYTAKFFHDFGPVSLNLTGGYARNSVDSRTDYNLAVEKSLVGNQGLTNLYNYSHAVPAYGFLQPVADILMPNGPGGPFCQSDADPNDVGVYGGNAIGCYNESLDFDRSRISTRQYSIEGHIDSAFDGPFNFLLGAIYFDSKSRHNDYFVNAFGLDYGAGVLGSAASAAIPGVNGNTFLATPFYRNDSDTFRLKSYGIFGETYFDFSNKLKLTLGLRWNHDQKYVKARNLTLDVLTPLGASDITQGLNYSSTDFDSATPGVQSYAVNNVSFGRLTGRAVLDYQITPDNLLYASYSRGYKSGGINPPLPANFDVPRTFEPESVNAFEIGSKNTFGNGALRLNLTAFYYQYKNLQLSRIVARTSVNDNVDADIYGLEAEAVVSPIPAFVVNMNASYLHTKVTTDKYLANPRDPSGGRSDAVIIKDITNASNCAVGSGGAGAAATNAFVGAVNQVLGAGLGDPNAFPAPQPVPGTSTTGAYSVCGYLQAAAAGALASLGENAAQSAQLAAAQAQINAAFTGSPTGTLPFTYYGSGVPVNIRGNQLPQAPTYKFAVGAQYTIDFDNGMSLVPRVDLNYTGNAYASIFNMNVDRMQGYEVVNAQVQFNGPDDRWYIRGFVQNLTDNDATTGQYVTDQSSGLYTNIFTIEPRRYGIAAGFKF